MSDEFMTLLLIGGIFLLFGILFIIASLLITNNQKKKQKRCVSSTKGKVIDLVETGNDAESRFYLHAVFEYTVNGETIHKQSSYGSKDNHFSIGQEIEVRYNPLNHHDYFVVEEKNLIKTITKVFLILGGLFSFVGIILLIIAMMIK